MTTTKLNPNQTNDYILEYGMARQAIINGNFDINQRTLETIALTDVTRTYLVDHWSDYISKDGGTLPTLTRTREIEADDDGSYYFIRLTTNGAGSSLGVSSNHQYSQKIEYGTRYLCGVGKKVTVSFWARSSIANKRLGISLRQFYGSGGSPSNNEPIKGTPITLTSSWVRYTATFTTNTLVGKTFGTNKDDFLELVFWYMWGTTVGNNYIQTGVTAETFGGAGTIDIKKVQLCAGDVALPFMPKSFEEELRACQRYYWRLQETNTTIQHANYYGINVIFFQFNLPTTMRIAPTCSVGGTATTDWDVISVDAGQSFTSQTSQTGLKNMAYYSVTKNSHGLSLAGSERVRLALKTASGYIDASAEI